MDLFQRKVKDKIISNIEPSVLGLFDLEVLTKEDKKYLKITIAKGYETPYHIKGMGMTPDSCFIRVGSSNEKMDEHLINKMFRERTKKFFKKYYLSQTRFNFYWFKNILCWKRFWSWW